MSIIKSLVNMKRDLESKVTLKSQETEFNVFTPNVVQLERVVDKPNDYYFEGDTLTYIITLKNNGIKRISDFTLRDTSVSVLDPMPNGYYEVITTNGEVTFDLDEVIISNITLDVGESLEIRISGIVKSKEESTEEELF